MKWSARQDQLVGNHVSGYRFVVSVDSEQEARENIVRDITGNQSMLSVNKSARTARDPEEGEMMHH